MSANASIPESIAEVCEAWAVFQRSFGSLLKNLEDSGQTLATLVGGAPVKKKALASSDKNGVVTVEMLRASIEKKASRPGPLAQQFHTSEKEIRRLVESPDSGLQYIGRGWVKLKEGARP